MNLDDSKNDSRKILPKIKWEVKEKKNPTFTQKEPSSESFSTIRAKREIFLKSPKIFFKRSPTNYHLIKLDKLTKASLNINNSESQNIYTPINNSNNKIELVNPKKRDIIESEFPLILNNRNNQLPKSNTNDQLDQNVLNMNDIYRINHINKKNGNKSAIISNKLIANRLLSVKLSNRDKNIPKRYLIRNKHYGLSYSPSSAYISFSNETQKNNNTNIHNSFKNNETKLLPLSLKEKNVDIQALFISKLNMKSISETKRSKRFKKIKYVKKWDLPKSFSFNKIAGRQKEIKNPLKLKYMERFFEYTPNYDSILCNNNKAYVKYNPDLKKNFKYYKINNTRKYVFNRLNIMNNPGNNYNIINLILNEQKEKEQRKYEKKFLDKILDEFIHYHKKNKELDE